MIDPAKKDDTIRKVRALLATAESLASQGNDEAAANYISKAHELRQSYEIEDAALRDAADLESENIISEILEAKGTYSKRRSALMWSIAKQCNCSGYVTKLSSYYTVTLFGTKGDIEYAKVLIDSLVGQMDRSMQSDWKKVKNTTHIHGKTFGASYLEGFRSRITSRLEQSNRVVQKKAAETLSSSTSLVLVERAKRADDEMRAKVGKLRSINMGQISSNYGYNHGSAAADRANLARGAVGNAERKALT